ncbi:MAG: N-formylglutamate amidohydrolase [Planctomycetota bacterium]
MPRCLVTTVHHSRHVPDDVLAAMAFDGDADSWLDQLFAESDPYTDAIFDVPGQTHVRAEVSRFVCDLNRHRDDRERNGVVKRTDFASRPFYADEHAITEADIADRLRRFYDPFEAAADAALSEVDFFIDGHAMTALGPAMSSDPGKPRPPLAVIIGGGTYDRLDHTSLPPDVARDVAEIVRDCFGVDRVPINDPFDYGDLQNRLSDPSRPNRRPGFLLEINQNLYLDSAGRPLRDRIQTLRGCVADLVERVAPLMEHAHD